ncbi:MAG: replicative helicase loader/inhibitor [Negativicutes bacterium]
MNRQDSRRELTPLEIKMLALVVLASSSYPSMQNKDPQPIVMAWSMMLADIPLEILQAAVVKVCRDSEFFPSVAQIAAAAADLDPRNEKLPTAAEAWEEVERLIIHFGPYRAPVYSCDTVKRAVRAIGWRQLCCGENPAVDRAHFLKLYESMRNQHKEAREIEQVMKIAGVGDVLKELATGMNPGCK